MPTDNELTEKCKNCGKTEDDHFYHQVNGKLTLCCIFKFEPQTPETQKGMSKERMERIDHLNEFLKQNPMKARSPAPAKSDSDIAHQYYADKKDFNRHIMSAEQAEDRALLSAIQAARQSALAESEKLKDELHRTQLDRNKIAQMNLYDFHKHKEQVGKLLKYKAFYNHIKSHFEKEHPDWKVECKICGKSIDEITDYAAKPQEK